MLLVRKKRRNLHKMSHLQGKQKSKWHSTRATPLADNGPGHTKSSTPARTRTIVEPAQQEFNTDLIRQDQHTKDTEPPSQNNQDKISKPKENIVKPISKSIKRCRERYKLRKRCKHGIEATIINDNDDPRPFVKINIGKETVFGLLDSGASISALGQGAEQLLERNDLRWLKVNSNVKTADGVQQRILGKVHINIKYNGRTELMTFYIVPSLKQPLYLGVDFWKKFKIAPQIISEITTPERTDPNMHQLTTQQTDQLNEIIAQFPSYEKQGLGLTNITEHDIETGDAIPVRQKCYPVSPAVQKEIFAEIDRMLEMGVLEESQSEWRSPVVLVKQKSTLFRLTQT